MEDKIEIRSRDYRFKVVEFLQQNWALVDETTDGVIVYFFGDTAGVFDEMVFDSAEAAETGLLRNGFKRYVDDPDSQEFIAIPDEPFVRRPHPNRAIYSSGRYWK
ncbi:MAG: hypothetical protein IPK01_00570 [Acidobacteria bacterium]|nr:hypothetical protein [Acidobacteriota bacterium]